jgi:hypothetical protein
MSASRPCIICADGKKAKLVTALIADGTPDRRADGE